MRIRTLVAAAVFVVFSSTAEAAKVCAWVVESNESDDERLLTLWLQSNADIDFLYKVGGDGIVTHSGKGNSPSDGTFDLMAGKADTPWKYGSTLDSAGRIDVTLELHRTPADVFSNAPTPLLAKFAFARNVSENEKMPPPTLARKQCATIAPR